MIFMKKQEPMLNTYNPILSYIYRSNTDVTSLMSGTAIKSVIVYVTDYITKTTLKTHTIFDSILSVFQRNTELLQGTLSQKEQARRLLTKIVNHLSAKMEFGAPIIGIYLLDNPDHYTDHSFVKLY